MEGGSCGRKSDDQLPLRSMLLRNEEGDTHQGIEEHIPWEGGDVSTGRIGGLVIMPEY